MSELIDSNYVAELAKGLNLGQIAEKEVSQEICSQVENELRSLIEDSIKFMTHFKRDKLTVADIEYALKDRNYYDKIFGYDVCEKVAFKKHANFWVKQDEERDLQSYLDSQVKSLRKQVQQPTISCWWVSVDGKIPPINENKMIKNKAALVKYDELKKEELSKNFNVIKDKPRSLLTDEINKFFIEITKVIAETEQIIDDPLKSAPGAPFQETPKLKIILGNLQTNSGLTSLVPFLLNYLYQDFDQQQLNGVAKKFISLKVLNSLIYNTGINIEYHLHIIIRMLIHFISGGVLSVNPCVDERQMREQSAHSLSLIINRFTFKYLNLKQNIAETLHGILKDSLTHNALNYQMLIGILITFQHFEANIIRTLVLPTTIAIFTNSHFKKDLNALSASNMSKQLNRSHSLPSVLQNSDTNIVSASQENHHHQQQQVQDKHSNPKKPHSSSHSTKQQIAEHIRRNNEAHILFNELQTLILKVFNEYSFATSKSETLLFQELEEQFLTELNPLVIRLIYNNMPIQLKYTKESQYNPSYMNLML